MLSDLLPACCVDLEPLTVFQLHIQSPDGEIESFKLAASHECDRSYRMIQDPCVDDGRRTDAVALSDLFDLGADCCAYLVTCLLEDPSSRKR